MGLMGIGINHELARIYNHLGEAFCHRYEKYLDFIIKDIPTVGWYHSMGRVLYCKSEKRGWAEIWINCFLILIMHEMRLAASAPHFDFFIMMGCTL